MAAFVLDASVAIFWCFPGDPAEDTPYSRRVLSMYSRGPLSVMSETERIAKWVNLGKNVETPGPLPRGEGGLRRRFHQSVSRRSRVRG
jgi:hypothetical protein